MRFALPIALLAVLAGCDGPPALPQPNGPMLTWNTAMWGVAAPPPAREVVPPGTPRLATLAFPGPPVTVIAGGS